MRIILTRRFTSQHLEAKPNFGTPRLWMNSDKLSMYGRVQIVCNNCIPFGISLENLKSENTTQLSLHIHSVKIRLYTKTSNFQIRFYRIPFRICVSTPHYSVRAVGYFVCLDPSIIISTALCLYRSYFKSRVKFNSYPLICVLRCWLPTSTMSIL